MFSLAFTLSLNNIAFWVFFLKQANSRLLTLCLDCWIQSLPCQFRLSLRGRVSQKVMQQSAFPHHAGVSGSVSSGAWYPSECLHWGRWWSYLHILPIQSTLSISSDFHKDNLLAYIVIMLPHLPCSYFCREEASNVSIDILRIFEKTDLNHLQPCF